ncbi:MAG: exodeoxyribonuclease VII large subunit [Francisellaceae bacterium]|jgi:exodeoxyribonuclease VII large subunit|nr:exodeoxyribonuclease VII large subunit [Francisellaceae bacterium]MBT6206481.1 exodeoxyribonuclease VII large subunit [Francisellaceae bacterium]MBT6539197.1 exodeoxyribonuclease VII large subunit [Francisellaceae bacterium]
MISCNILTVSELNTKVQTLFQKELDTFWVTGEISNYTVPRSGHWYFTIKDESAQVRCVMFTYANRDVKFIPKDGTKVNLLAKASLYGARGDFQLMITAMVDAGIGKLQLAYQALVQKLSTAGLFADSAKQKLPALPKQIGIVTSATGAALHDILNVLQRRSSLTAIKLYPTIVQGDSAPQSIIKAIESCNAENECDVIILARGGGSIEDLWAFNNEELAHCIFSSQIPIISGIGHETDFTISDLVADVRAPTPSAAAEIVSIDTNQLLERLGVARKMLATLIHNKLDKLSSRVIYLKTKLPDPKHQIHVAQERTNSYKATLLHSMQLILQEKESYFLQLASQLNTLSPLSTLARGYSIILDSKTGAPITTFAQACIGDQINIMLKSGQLRANVTESISETVKGDLTCEKSLL